MFSGEITFSIVYFLEHESDEELNDFHDQCYANDGKAYDVMSGHSKISDDSHEGQQHEYGVERIAHLFSVLHCLIFFLLRARFLENLEYLEDLENLEILEILEILEGSRASSLN